MKTAPATVSKRQPASAPTRRSASTQVVESGDSSSPESTETLTPIELAKLREKLSDDYSSMWSTAYLTLDT